MPVRSRILIVEDDPLVAELIAGALNDDGYSVATTATVAGAVRELRETDVGAVLLDCLLPGERRRWRLVAADGSLNFPNARYFIGEGDFNYWTDDTKIPKNYPARPHFLNQARKNLLPVKGTASISTRTMRRSCRASPRCPRRGTRSATPYS